MQEFEYNFIFNDEYKKYSKDINIIIDSICDYTNISKVDLTYKEVISYFEENYKIKFIFFGANTYFFQEEIIMDKVRFPDLVKRSEYKSVDETFCRACSGMTMPSTKNRNVVFINQLDVPVERVIFTILHELAHISLHINNKNKRDLYVLLNQDNDKAGYSDELEPFENEANIAASMFYITDEYLEQAIKLGKSFKCIQTEKRISKSALHNRLLNYFFHNLKIGPPILASYTVNGFKNNDIRSLDTVRKKLNRIKNIESSEHFKSEKERLDRYYETYNPNRLHDY